MKIRNNIELMATPTKGSHVANVDYVDGKQKTISWAEYQALTEDEKNDGTLYDIPDMPTAAGQDDVLRTSDVVTELNDTVTDDQVVGAEALFNMFKSKNLDYYVISSIDGTGVDNPLGLTEATLTDIYNKIPTNCMLLLDTALDTTSFYGLPSKYFTILWARRYTGRDMILATQTNTNSFYICTNVTNQTWEKICTNEWKTGIEIVNTTAYSDDVLKFPVGKYYIYSSYVSSFSNLPEQIGGTLEVFSITPNYNLDSHAWCFRTYRYTTYLGKIYTRGLYTAETAGTIAGDTGWSRVYTTKVNDVGKTTITTFDDSRVTGEVTYKVTNGICYILCKDLRCTEIVANLQILNTLPKASMTVGNTGITSSVNGAANIYAYVSEGETKLSINSYVAGAIAYLSFSYPVAES